ncbi:MAG: hypothetical protein KDB23_08820 [Planctomycetales bacterium]|nr:hypothetical protein [Planctomycetales bacterium]
MEATERAKKAFIDSASKRAIRRSPVFAGFLKISGAEIRAFVCREFIAVDLRSQFSSNRERLVSALSSVFECALDSSGFFWILLTQDSTFPT